MSNAFLSIRGISLPRRMILQGIASVFAGTVTPDALAAAAKSCQVTERDILGPFYRFGAPFQTKLAGPNEPGERLIMRGKVYSSDCRTHLPNTLIEIWQANKAGLYDTDKPGNFTEHVGFHLRGMMLTDQHGRYEFEIHHAGKIPNPTERAGAGEIRRVDAAGAHPFPSFKIAAYSAHHTALFQGRSPYRQRSLGQPQTIAGDRSQAGWEFPAWHFRPCARQGLLRKQTVQSAKFDLV